MQAIRVCHSKTQGYTKLYPAATYAEPVTSVTTTSTQVEDDRVGVVAQGGPQGAASEGLVKYAEWFAKDEGRQRNRGRCYVHSEAAQWCASVGQGSPATVIFL